LYIEDTVLDLLQDCFRFACFSTSQTILLFQRNSSTLDMLGSSLPNILDNLLLFMLLMLHVVSNVTLVCLMDGCIRTM
jgi:hypothetical protein